MQTIIKILGVVIIALGAVLAPLAAKNDLSILTGFQKTQLAGLTGAGNDYCSLRRYRARDYHGRWVWRSKKICAANSR